MLFKLPPTLVGELVNKKLAALAKSKKKINHSFQF